MGVPGNIGDLGVGVQTAKGTPAATALHRMIITGGGIAPSREVMPLEGSTGSRVRMGAFVGRARAGGTPSTYLMADVAATLLYGALGAKASVSSGGSTALAAAAAIGATNIKVDAITGMAAGDYLLIGTGATGERHRIAAGGVGTAGAAGTGVTLETALVNAHALGASVLEDPVTHTLTIATAQPFLTFWRNISGILAERFPDCKLAQVVLRSAEGAALTIELTIVGLGAHYQTTALVAPDIEIDQPFIHHDAEQQLLVEGVAVASMRSVTITISTGATVIPGDNLVGYSVAEGLIGVRIETQQLIENAALWNRLHYGAAAPANNAPLTRGLLELAGAPAGLDLKWTKRDDAGVALAPERSLEIQTPRIVLAEFGGMETNSNGEPLVATVTYDAYQPAGGVSAVTAIVRNGLAAIAAS